jgi:hypothetical protein
MVEKAWKKKVTEEALQAQIQKAKAAWIDTASIEPRAASIEFKRQSKLFTVKLSSGAQFIFPSRLIREIAGASLRDLADVHLSESGDSIHWEKLDVDFSIPGLITRILGTQLSMSELARQGGRKISIAKSEAARQNGKKGGRPRKKDASVSSPLEI